MMAEFALPNGEHWEGPCCGRCEGSGTLRRVPRLMFSRRLTMALEKLDSVSRSSSSSAWGTESAMHLVHTTKHKLIVPIA
jgi:hypothetical protein